MSNTEAIFSFGYFSTTTLFACSFSVVVTGLE